MSKKIVEVSQNDIDHAYQHFMELFYPAKTDTGKGMHLWAFIGMKNPPTHGYMIEWKMPEENARFLRMLAGPHYRAMAKAMLLNGHQYKIPVVH